MIVSGGSYTLKDTPVAIKSDSLISIYASTIFSVSSFPMPPKIQKKATAGLRKTSEVVSDSGDEFEHLSMER